MKRAIGAIAFLLLSAAAAVAGYSTMGVGASSCATFAQQYMKNARVTETVYFSWAQGFMSGMNVGLLRQTGRTMNLQSMTLDMQKARLRQFCGSNPRATYQAAVISLFLALEKNAPAASGPVQKL